MKWALTGGIGCGKSAALSCFKALDVQTLDADMLCRDVYEKHADILARAFADRWTRSVLDSNGLINRSSVAEIVFSDEDELSYLNRLLHPLIETELNEKLASFNASERVIVEIPLLFELNWQSRFDKTICVWAPEQTVSERLLRRGLTQTDIVARRAAQISADEKLSRADYGLINSGDMAFLYAQCDQLLTF